MPGLRTTTRSHVARPSGPSRCSAFFTTDVKASGRVSGAAREHPATGGALERDERVELLGEDVGPYPPHEKGRDENDGGTDAPTAVQ